MANSKEQKLFTEFPPVSTEQWEAVIAADLKGADYEKKLVWKTAEGFDVRPYYRAGDLENLGFTGSESGAFPYVRGIKKNNNWLIHETICVESPADANARATALLTRGAESIGFNIDDKEFTAADLDTLLAGFPLKSTEITFCGCAAPKAAHLFIDKVAAAGYDLEEVYANFILDPIIKKLTLNGTMGCKKGECTCFTDLAGLIRKAGPYKRMRLVGVNGHMFGNSGSTLVQELAFTLAAGHEYVVKLMEAGLSIDQAAPSIRFIMSIGSNYFMEIAKFRAARMLWANIVQRYNPTRSCAVKMKTHAVTSRWNMTVYDPYVNMLRATTEAMSAAVAGVHSIEVLPFNAAYEKPTEFSSRIARNVQLLLKKESHFDQVADPAGGAYYIETLTNSMADQAWALFKEVEEKGGYIAAFQSGFIQDKVEASAAKKNMNIATRREILLGTNQYPNFGETADASVSEEAVTPGSGCRCSCTAPEGVRPLKPYRGAMEFEQMRLKVDRSGRAPKAFMVTVGNLTFARARAQFSCNFFACAGIRVQDNTYFQSVEEGIAAAVAAKADIVVICAADDDYAALAPEAYKLLDGRGIFVVAGAPASQPELEAVGITNFISVRSNVLETLKYYLTALEIE